MSFCIEISRLLIFALFAVQFCNCFLFTQCSLKKKGLERPRLYVSSEQIQEIFDKCEVERTEELNELFNELYQRTQDVPHGDDFISNESIGDLLEEGRPFERPSEIVKREIEEEASKWKHHPDDCGSSEYQIAMLTVRIRHLTTHFLKNKQDKHGKRGMAALVHRRRKLMNYLYRNNKQKALEMAKALDFTFRPNDRPWDSRLKYAQYTKTKNVKKKRGRLVKKVIPGHAPM